MNAHATQLMRLKMKEHNSTICTQDSRITKIEEQLKTVFENQKRMQKTLDNIDKTQDKLEKVLTQLSTSLNTITTIGKWLIVPVVVYVLSELAKMFLFSPK